MNGYSEVYEEHEILGEVGPTEAIVIEVDGEEQTLTVKEGTTPEEVVIQDEPGCKVIETHSELSDGRELVTTTTLTVNSDGEQTEEIVYELIENEYVEEEISETEEVTISSPDVPSEQIEADSEQIYEAIDTDPETQTTLGLEENVHDEPIALKTSMATVTETEAAEEATDEPADLESSNEAFNTSSDSHSLRRHISYEEFQEQFTEYKPPKRYEKKSKETAADKIAPKTTIMGLPSGPPYAAAPLTGEITSPRSMITADGSFDEMSGAQPTRTQGSVIRRMDSNSQAIDPENLVRAEDKPDLEAELPALGTSSSLKAKFQSLGGDSSAAVDFSKPPSHSASRNSKRFDTAQPLSPRSSTISTNGDYKEPKFEGGEVENVPEVRADVMRESDRNDEEELPEAGFARSMLSRFKEIEVQSENLKKSQYNPSGVGNKPSVTPLRPKSANIEVVNSENYVMPEQTEGGEFENQPEVRADVVKEADRNDEEELPAVGMAKNLAAMFKDKEETAKATPNYKPSGAGYRRTISGSSTPTFRQTSRSSSTEPRREPEFEGGEVENVPEVRADVVRESDRNDDQELPATGYAKSLKEKMLQLRQEQLRPEYMVHTPSGIGNKATPTPLGRGHMTSPATRSLSGSRHSMNSVSEDGDHTLEIIEPQVEGGEYENQPIRRDDVIREEDRNDMEELPEQGLAKNLRSKFLNLEAEAATARQSQYKPSGLGTKATPSKLHIMAGRSSYHASGSAPAYSPASVVSNAEDSGIEQEPEAGEYENEPVKRDDVIRADMTNDEEELPQQGSAKGLLSRFQSIEQESTKTVQHRPSGVGNKPTPTAYRPKSLVTEDQTEPRPTPEGSRDDQTTENVEEVNPNVVKVTDTNDNEFIPTAGAAKLLANKFKELESQKSDHVDHKPSKIASSSTPTPLSLKR